VTLLTRFRGAETARVRGPAFGGGPSGYHHADVERLPLDRQRLTTKKLKQEVSIVGLSASLILIAVGAILTWAVTADVNGLNVNTVGVILMVVGIAGALISFIFWSSWGGFGGYRRDVVVRDHDHVVER
jgi:hypothetical protein